LLARGDALVLVDDELSTGRTAVNTIAALHAVVPHRRYVLAALVDLRGRADQEKIAAYAAELGVRIDVVALARGAVSWPDDFPARAAQAVSEADPALPAGAAGEVVRHDELWSADARASGRHGFTPGDVRAARKAASAVADALAPSLPPRTLVLGTEELMYAPTLIALELAERGVEARVSATTRSPVFALDAPGYPIRSVLHYESPDGEPRFAYNATGFAEIVLVTDEPNEGLVARLQRVCGRVRVVALPSHRPLPQPLHGPEFGSYAAGEVSWLLTDLSAVALEAPIEEREEAVQSGGAHYAESLPIEFQPDAEYQRLFEQALDGSAERVAHAVGVVTELILAERGPAPVLASLARAGTPAGILLRRWARFAHGLDLPHYTLSIVRGRGIDQVALRYLALRHDPRSVVFVDGWTGKGAIARELAAALAGTPFDPRLAVLADPGSCVTTFGTREDFLVPSACLNSTVSGLVSRTVLNRHVLAPGQFHGAKFYRELAGADVSNRFLDAISSRFADVAERVAADWPAVRAGDREPTWTGWAAVEAISKEYGIDDVTLVKPGVGESTRVLLRRVPWLVLARPGASDDLAHVRLLAEQRGVPVREVDGLAYRCVGLIHPRYTRGATGADGRTVQ
jgi:hypothetical protein